MASTTGTAKADALIAEPTALARGGGRFTFDSPAITAAWAGGRWTVRREGKGDWLEFSRVGGWVYRSGETEPVARLDLRPEVQPAWGRTVRRTCECGHGKVDENLTYVFATESEAVEDMAFLFLS